MKELGPILESISKLKRQCQELNSMISSKKEQDISVKFYLNNMKKMSLQAMDLFNAMEKQASYFKHQKKSFLEKKLREQKGELHGLPMVR